MTALADGHANRVDMKLVIFIIHIDPSKIKQEGTSIENSFTDNPRV